MLSFLLGKYLGVTAMQETFTKFHVLPHFSAESWSIVWMYQNLLIYLFTLVSSSLAIMNGAAIKHQCAGFRVDLSFQFIWINTEEHERWI